MRNVLHGLVLTSLVMLGCSAGPSGDNSNGAEAANLTPQRTGSASPGDNGGPCIEAYGGPSNLDRGWICHAGLACNRATNTCYAPWGEGTLGRPCTAESTCEQGLSCFNGYCLGLAGSGCNATHTVDPKRTNWCSDGLACEEGVCVPVLGQVGDPCTSFRDCALDLECSSSVCVCTQGACMDRGS